METERISIQDSFPVVKTLSGGLNQSEYPMENLLFRKPNEISDGRTKDHYRDKVVVITGGGGSIGSELCRQMAKLRPKQLIILDICENGAYDVQQELWMEYGRTLDLRIEIASVTNARAMAAIFERYRPQIVINAAAHKHVPLMEHNSIEAIENNVFGTKVQIDLCERYGVEQFIMISTDKAVNPANVMGATKRMCEMMAVSSSSDGSVKYSVTRFGNVLGSAGSAVPLFRKQIAAGGPVTITDRRISRYFMTVEEAAQLVLQSGAMAENGELFVLDMGKPVKILDLAESMIKLSGAENIEIVETGLRPGEKLHEELFVKTEELRKTSNDMIFIEKDRPLPAEDIASRLKTLNKACLSGDEELARKVLMKAVQFHSSSDDN